MNPRQKTLRPKPPDKGSFPLDHEVTSLMIQVFMDFAPGECKAFMLQYTDCLKRSSSDNHQCRAESRAYLQCRMDKQLMAKEDFKKLGYHDNGERR